MYIQGSTPSIFISPHTHTISDLPRIFNPFYTIKVPFGTVSKRIPQMFDYNQSSSRKLSIVYRFASFAVKTAYLVPCRAKKGRGS